MTVRPTILLTRPKHDAEKDAQNLKNLGYTTISSPLLAIESVQHSDINTKHYNALLFTSANAVRFFKNHDTSRTVFAVGNNTTDALIKAGYKTINNASGTAKDLEALICNKQKTSDKLAFIRGQDIAYPLSNQLKKHGFGIDEYITYKTTPTKTLTSEAAQKIKNENCSAITLYSKKTAEYLIETLEKTALLPHLKQTKLLCISPSVLEYVHSKMPHNTWQGTYSAQTPDRDGMLSLIQQEIKI